MRCSTVSTPTAQLPIGRPGGRRSCSDASRGSRMGLGSLSQPLTSSPKHDPDSPPPRGDRRIRSGRPRRASPREQILRGPSPRLRAQVRLGHRTSNREYWRDSARWKSLARYSGPASNSATPSARLPVGHSRVRRPARPYLRPRRRSREASAGLLARPTEEARSLMSCGSARHGFETPRPEIVSMISGL